jgi:ATP-dependent DNA helicase RecQ
MTPIELLKKHFGYNSFRPLQEDIINSVLQGRDTLALLPTGGGKSVCYQIPALALGGLCLVVTPLIALMKDQAQQLHRRNIPALFIHSGMAWYEVKKALENAQSGHFRFLFVSPERLQSQLFRNYLPGMPITLLAVDEAHCISQWGYDFRPPYLKIAEVSEVFPDVPVLALTASATPAVQNDICDKLVFKSGEVFRQSFARPNLSFSCIQAPDKLSKLLHILQHVPGCALVYTRNRRKTREIAHLLSMQGIAATYYHAGLPGEERDRRQDDWVNNRQRVMVCTNAFGMGIDKPDVRLVVHIDVPDCPENYYQEAGRAGRDSRRSYAVLLYTHEELKALEMLPDQKYPDVKEIRLVYQSVGNYLQVPVGSGAEQYYDFDITLFCERFKHDALQVANVMGTLQQAGYVSFSEQVFALSKAGFVCSKEYLYQFEHDQPQLEPLVKALLRSYEGIFDNVVSVKEKNLAKLLRTDEAAVVKQLNELVQYQVIQYEPRKDSPQVYFLYDRVPADQLVIDQKAYAERKALYANRIREMIRYATGQRTCRSVLLCRYFGEQDAQECGICDVCLERKRKLPTADEVRRAAEALKQQLQQPATVSQLRQMLSSVTARVFDEAMELLLREEEVVVMEDGRVRRGEK